MLQCDYMFELIDFVIVRPITNILFVIYGLVGDFGLAIILFTVLVKICMWPLVKRQLHQTRLMRKIQPQLAEIKKNCKGNRQLESLQMMDLYKRNNIKPFRSMLTIILQLPIFIALYTAVRVMVLPTPTDNLDIRAYSFVRNVGNIQEVIDKQKIYLAEESAGGEEAEQAKKEYDFHPKLFGVVDLDPRPGFSSTNSIVMLIFALASAGTQYWIASQQLPSKKTEKSRTFRQLVKEAADGKDPDQSEMNALMSRQMSKMMPLMLLLVMINLPGALVFYYFISNLLTGVQQKYILSKSESEMEISADKKLIHDLNKIEEAEVITNKKSGTTITHISAKTNRSRNKKKGRKL